MFNYAFFLFFLVFLSESIFSIQVIANTSTIIGRETSGFSCIEDDQQEKYCDGDKNNKIGVFNPIGAPKFEPRLTTGMMHYRYEDGLVGKLKGSMPFIGVGLLISHKKWVFDIHAQSSSINMDSNAQDVPFFLTTNKKEIFNTFQSREIERDDYTISLGYNIIDNMDNMDYRMIDLWLFSGYQKGITTIDTTAILFENELGQGDKRRATSRFDVDISVETDGPFIGLMIGKKIRNSKIFRDSKIWINYSYTRLNGEYNFRESQQIQPDSKESFVSGHKFGIDWNVPITNITSRTTLRLNLSLNSYRYKMNIERTSFFENLEAEFPVTEQIYSLRAAFLLQWW